MLTKRYHILVDVQNTSNKIIQDEKGLKNFLEQFPAKINMSVLKGPVIASGIPENPGLSGFVIIDYSHISIHTFSKNNEALVDIFSCKPYSQGNVVNIVLDYFKVAKSDARIQEVSWA